MKTTTNTPCTRLASQCLRRLSSTSAAEPQAPAAGGYLPSISSSFLLRSTRDQATMTPGITWSSSSSSSSSSSTGHDTRKMNTYQAIRDALSITLSTDKTALIFGEDVAFGGVFRCTLGLADEHGRERVFNTPLTEQGLVGFGIGIAQMGQTAIAEVQFADYVFPAVDQIVNEAAKFRYRSGGQFNVGGLTVRMPTMAVGHGGLYHSQSPEGFFMGASGLKIVIPRSPIQAKGLLLASIRDPNPVLFMEPKILYRSAVEQVPTSAYTLPLGRAETLISGTDLTVLTWGTSVYHCERAIAMIQNPPEELRRHISSSYSSSSTSRGSRPPSIELLDLRTILPYDLASIVESVNRTGRLVIVHEAGVTAGVGAEIGAEVSKRSFLKLEAPVRRVGGWDTPGVALQYEKFILPDAIRIMDAIIETLTY